MRASRITIAETLTAAMVLTVVAMLATPADSAACTAFAVPSDETVCGANLDWPDDLEGYVLVNPRGIEKAFVPWSGFGPSDHDGEPQTWVSKYASITLTCSGRDFIEGGMNERGLILEQASLPSVYPADDGRPGVSGQQWMQYALDSYQDVGEVVDDLESVRQDGEGWHYLVVDRSGDWAVIEFVDGSPVVYRAGRHELGVITNAAYEQMESRVPLDVRFIRLVEPLRDRRLSWLDFSAEPAEPEGLNALDRVDFAFALLDDVSIDNTQRSVVYDTGAMRVYWKSWRHSEIRYIPLASVQRGEGSGVRAVPIHAPLAGDARGALEPLSDEQNQELWEHASGLIGGVSDGEQDTD